VAHSGGRRGFLLPTFCTMEQGGFSICRWSAWDGHQFLQRCCREFLQHADYQSGGKHQVPVPNGDFLRRSRGPRRILFHECATALMHMVVISSRRYPMITNPVGCFTARGLAWQA
jgi:hypothetical protein